MEFTLTIRPFLSHAGTRLGNGLNQMWVVNLTALQSQRRKITTRTSAIASTAVVLAAILFLPSIALGILTTNQGAPATRIISTQNLTPAELAAYEL